VDSSTVTLHLCIHRGLRPGAIWILKAGSLVALGHSETAFAGYFARFAQLVHSTSAGNHSFTVEKCFVLRGPVNW
jgi:hypothetical protein